MVLLMPVSFHRLRAPPLRFPATDTSTPNNAIMAEAKRLYRKRSITVLVNISIFLDFAAVTFGNPRRYVSIFQRGQEGMITARQNLFYENRICGYLLILEGKHSRRNKVTGKRGNKRNVQYI